jgi:hypothetical protein
MVAVFTAMPDAIGAQLRGSADAEAAAAAEALRVAVAVGDAGLAPPPQATKTTHASNAAARLTRP